MSLALRQPRLGLGLGLVSKFSVLGAQDLGKTGTEKTAERVRGMKWWGQGTQRKAGDLQWGTWEAGLGRAEAWVTAGRRAGIVALLHMLWPHLGPRMDTVLQHQPAQHPHLPTFGYARPEAIRVQKQTLEPNPIAWVPFWLFYLQNK